MGIGKLINLGGRYADRKTDIDVPAGYNGEKILAVPIAMTITVLVADKLKSISVLNKPAGTSLVNGTNLISIYELEITKNGFTGSTGTDAGPIAYLYQTATADDASPGVGDAPVDGSGIEPKEIVSSPINAWSLLQPKLTFSATGTYQVTGYALYYAPGVY